MGVITKFVASGTSGKNLVVKTALIGGAALVAVILGGWIIKRVGKTFEKSERDKTSDDTINSAKAEIRQKYITFSQSDFQAKANALEEAFYGVGTDETTVFSTIGSLRTQDDWKALIVTYGKKDINKYDNFTVDLVTALNKELDTEELAILKKILSKINVSI